MSRVVTIVALLFLLAPCRSARAEEPAPDPSRGETYDGLPHRPGWRDDVKLVPRLVLTPMRGVFRGIGWVAHKLLDWDEVNRVHETVFEAFSTDDGKIGVRPAFQYSISFTPVVGLRFFDQKLLGPSTNFEAQFLTGGVNVIYAEVHARPTPNERAFQASINAIYNRRNDQVFTGIGYTTDDKRTVTVGSRYAVDSLDAGGLISTPLAPGLYVDAAGGFGLRRFGNGIHIADEPPIADIYCVRDLSGLCKLGTVDEVRVPGFNRGTQFFRAGATIRVDSRDNWYRPSSGALIEAGLDWTHGLGFDTSHYVRAHAAVSAVLDLWQRSRTIVIRFEFNDVEPISGQPVPFTELISLGGPDTFRGFRPGRFRNYSSVFAAAEYRWPIWMWMDATIFTEYGGVFGRAFEGFALERMKPDVGAGIRVRSSDAFFARAQFAYGWGDRWQFFFSVNTGL
ncbi:MAG: hypothetical protein JWN44_6596 [Myxococcales bacterium]|nr:hypothetical protein [Myxococcales bacterium]